jgi:uncharacterized protein (TIRG00374 family)
MDLASAPGARSNRARSMAWRGAVGLAAGAILILTFLKLVGAGAVFRRLEHLNLGFAVLCGIPFLAAYVVRALRWRCLLRPDRIPRRRIIGIYLIATFLNWLLPIRGGELAKSLLLRQTDGVPVSRSLATISMDKAMDLLPAVCLLVLLPFVGLHLSRPLWVLLGSALAAVGFVAVVIILAAWRRDRAVGMLTRPLAAVLPRRMRGGVGPFIGQFVDTLVALIRQPLLLLRAAGYTVVAVSLDALFCLLAFRAVDVAVPVVIVLYGYTFFNLAFILPTPPGQVGSNELIGLLIFSGMFGISRVGVGAMFLFSHPWTAILLTCAGLVCLSAMGLNLRGTMRMARGGAAGKPRAAAAGRHRSQKPRKSWRTHDGARDGSSGLSRPPVDRVAAGPR